MPHSNTTDFNRARRYMDAGLLTGSHYTGWRARLGHVWRAFPTRRSALTALSNCRSAQNTGVLPERTVAKGNHTDYAQAGVFIRCGLLKGSHTTGWSAKVGGVWCTFPTRNTALRALRTYTDSTARAPAPALPTEQNSGDAEDGDDEDEDDDGDDDDFAQDTAPLHGGNTLGQLHYEERDDDDFAQDTAPLHGGNTLGQLHYEESDEIYGSDSDIDGSECLVLHWNDQTATHCGWCSDPGPITLRKKPYKAKIPLADLPRKFRDEHLDDSRGAVVRDDYGGLSKFWRDLHRLVERDDNNCFSQKLRDALNDLVDGDGIIVQKDNGGCDCCNNYTEMLDPYVMTEQPSEDEDNYEIVESVVWC